MTISEIRQHLADGSMTAREIVDAYIERIEKRDASIGAFLEVFAADARLQADEVDKMDKDKLPPLAGVPIAIKDNILMQGKVATAGSSILENYKASYDATVVKKLREAGAILVGRTNMDEFACGSSTETGAYGVTKNPVDQDRVAGGSSGGSTAAVAAEFVPAALGSDTGGSVRQPASLCGVVGFKPTYGAVSRYGLMAMASSLDQISPIAMSVADIAEVMRVIGGEDEGDATTRGVDVAFPEFGSDVKGLKIGVPKQFFDKHLDSALGKVVKDAIDEFVKGGAEVVELDMPELEDALAAYYILMPAEVSSNLNRYDGVQYGNVQQGADVIAQARATRSAGFGDEVKRRILLGTYVLSAGYVDAYYKTAERARQHLRTRLEAAFDTVDVIMGPTSPTVAWKLGEKFDDPLAMYLADIYTVVANLCGVPALSVPCGEVDGLPVGLQIMGARGEDSKVLDVGHWFETKS